MEDSNEWNMETDFVVVGLGAGGAVVMRKLVDAGFHVIGLEAGDNRDADPLILNSLNAPTLFPANEATYFHNQVSMPNPDMNGRTLSYTTGCLLGGGSSINGLLYTRPTDKFWIDFAAAVGGPNWGAAQALARFVALENFIGVAGAFNPAVHGTNGKMRIRQCPDTVTTFTTKFTTALATATSQPIISDYNDPATPIGIFQRWSLFEKPDGDRASTSTDFLTPILNNNHQHKIVLECKVDKLLFDNNNRIKGVKAIRNGNTIRIKVNKEVILCAGIYSNEILQRSGIGPSALLTSLGIPVVYANDNVGAKSFNHLGGNLAIFTANPADFPGTGPDFKSLYTGGAMLPSPIVGSDQTRRAIRWVAGNAPSSGPVPPLLIMGFSLLPMESVGNDRIQNRNPLRVSQFTENLLSDPDDLNTVIAVYQQQITALATAISAIDPFYQLIEPPLSTINDNFAIANYIKTKASHEHHWVGTCAMGPDAIHSVTTHRGRVFGVDGVRVADASACPIQTDHNTTSLAIVIGDTIADIVINKYS